MFRFKKGVNVLLGAVATFVLWHIFSSSDYSLVQIDTQSVGNYVSGLAAAADELIQDQQGQVKDFGLDEKLAIFPSSFPNVDLNTFYHANFGNLSVPRLFRYSGRDRVSASQFVSQKVAGGEFHQHPIKIFHSDAEQFDNDEKCSSLEADIRVDVSKSQSLHVPLEKIVGRFMEEKDDYYQDLEPLFKDVPRQLEEKTIDEHWWRLAGSSVWLEEYGVHFLVSRVIYSPKKVRDCPIVSMLYGQVFNEEWEELTNVELIAPTNEKTGGEYINLKYPNFLPVPIFYDATAEDGWFGPEDPRIIMTKNAKGFEEPLVVFNAFHRKLEKDEDDTSKKGMETKYKYFRSMFVAWPWQFQRGKVNVEGLLNESGDDQLFTRSVELRIKGEPRAERQKNWAPFISNQDRQVYQHDKFMYFVYAWSNLQVLKCELSGIPNKFSYCSYEYVTREGENSVGDLRGGTQLININHLIAHEKKYLPSVASIFNNIPPSQEIWIGLARAHLTGCGCNNFYRPNLVVVTKQEGKYKISHVSSFFSLDIPMLGWWIDQPNNLCAGNNVLIPNGISSWGFGSVKSETGDVETNDYMTLAYSVADYTVDIIHVRGLLKAILSMDKAPQTSVPTLGFNDNNADCAMKASVDFCKAYSEVHGEKKEEENA